MLDQPIFQYLLTALLVINIFTFAVFGFDKWVAGTQARRVPEKTLWLLSLLGGSLGGVLGMSVFHHKTRKLSFQLVMAGIFLVQLILIILIWQFRTYFQSS